MQKIRPGGQRPGGQQGWWSARLVEDSRYGKVFYVILSLQKDYKTAREN